MSRACEDCGAAGQLGEDGLCEDCAEREARWASQRQALADLTAQAREAAQYAREHGTVPMGPR